MRRPLGAGNKRHERHRRDAKRARRTHLPELCQVYLERLRIVFEPEGGHGIQDVLPTNRLALFHVAFFSGLRGDEADELGDALLDAFFGVLGNLGRGGDGLLHDAGHVGDLLPMSADGGRDKAVLTGRKRSCSLYSPTSCSVIGAGSDACGGVLSCVSLAVSSASGASAGWTSAMVVAVELSAAQHSQTWSTTTSCT